MKASFPKMGIFFFFLFCLIVPQKNFAQEKILTTLLGSKNQKSNYALIVEKETYRLNVFKTDQNGYYQLIKTYTVATGKHQGNKQSSGDKRTPEGIYLVTAKKDGRKLPSKYGSGAFILDYPNVFDKREQKTGHGIWIHGVENEKSIENYFNTDGCVALSNKDLRELGQYVSVFDTPVLITQTANVLNSKNSLERQKKEIIEFLSHRKGRSDKTQKDDFDVLPSPEKIFSFGNQILVFFPHIQSSSHQKALSQKLVYLQKKDTTYQMISEQWLPEQDTQSFITSALVRQNTYEYSQK
jgi:murein L,D-transpeptidase YafK